MELFTKTTQLNNERAKINSRSMSLIAASQRTENLSRDIKHARRSPYRLKVLRYTPYLLRHPLNCRKIHKKRYTSLTSLSSYIQLHTWTIVRKFSMICEKSIGVFAISDQFFEFLSFTGKINFVNGVSHQNLQ